ncbi:MAG: cyclic nucleotide-binding domain-containing protein, partial [Actinomycetes bacterium]
MAKDLYIARLKSVPLFKSLSKRELDLLLRQADHLRFPARYRVVREGSSGEEFWMVIEGELAVHRGGQDVAHLGPGDHFGEIALFHDVPRNATVTADADLSCLALSSWEFRPFVEAHPMVAWQLLETMSVRLAN